MILAHSRPGLLKNSEGNRDGEWIFCRRKEADVALFLHVTRMRKTFSTRASKHVLDRL